MLTLFGYNRVHVSVFAAHKTFFSCSLPCCLHCVSERLVYAKKSNQICVGFLNNKDNSRVFGGEYEQDCDRFFNVLSFLFGC